MGGDDVLDNMALVLGCWPSGLDRDYITGSEGGIWIMDKVVFWIGVPLYGGVISYVNYRCTGISNRRDGDEPCSRFCSTSGRQLGP